MAEDFHGGVCGGNWPWISSRNLFGSSPCSLPTNDIGSFGYWSNHDLVIGTKAARSSDDSAGSASDGGGSAVMDPPFQMMGVSLSSSTSPDEWNRDLLHDSGRSVENYSSFLLDSTISYQHETIEDSSVNSFKQVNQSFDPLQQQPLNSTNQCATTCTGLSNGFPLDSASYTHASSLMQTLFDTDSQTQPYLLDNQAMNYQVNTNGFLNSLSKASPMVNPSSSKPQPTNRMPLNTNTAPLWNATAAALSNIRPTFLPSTQSQFLPSSLSNKRPNLPSFNSKHQHEEGKDSASVAKKGSNEQAYKRQRIETPSPLPTFKVRKEKLGDRITALQQLVSPFGKTDTASVLHEATDYIKFLHDQVNALTTPYLRYVSPPSQRQQDADKPKDNEGLRKDLKSRGLCVVPISTTFPVAAVTPTDFWVPTFGVNLK